MRPEDKVWAVTRESRKDEDIPGREPTEPTVRIHAKRDAAIDKSTVIGSRPDWLTITPIAPPNRAESVVASYGAPAPKTTETWLATMVQRLGLAANRK